MPTNDAKGLTPDEVQEMYASELLWSWDKLVLLRHAFVLDMRSAIVRGDGITVNFCKDRIVVIDRELERRSASLK